MFEVGEQVKWMSPLDKDYSYGTIVSIKGNIATITGTGYYKGVKFDVHFRYIRKVKGGGSRYGGNKKHSKRSTP